MLRTARYDPIQPLNAAVTRRSLEIKNTYVKQLLGLHAKLQFNHLLLGCSETDISVEVPPLSLECTG